MSDADSGPEPGSRRRLVWGVVIALVALAGTTYVVHSGRTLEALHVRTSVPDCQGTDLRRDGAIRARAGMRCLVRVTISNESART